MKNVTRSFSAALVTASCLTFANVAAADSFMATITGSIAEGTLNTTDLAGREFVLTATLSDPTDLWPQVTLTAAAFAAEAATIHFGDSDAFDFDADQLAVIVASFGTDPTFQMGFTTNPPDPDNHNSNAIGYTDFSTTLPLFDANILQEIPFHDDFDGFAVEGPFTATNSSSDTLTITSLAAPPPASIQIAAVPEPSSLALLGSALLGLLAYARKSRRTAMAAR